MSDAPEEEPNRRRPLIATYRLQFREGMGFRQAEVLVPYL